MTSPKTEHHRGKDTRTILLFPELRPFLEEAFDAAPEGAVYAVDERFRASAQGPGGWRGCKLRTTILKIIRRAGLTPWPRLFHNLRSSRETELTERFPLHVVTAWLGHTEEIARRHYCQVTDEHFAQALTPGLTPAIGSGTESGTRAAPFPAQQPAAGLGKDSQETQKAPENQGFLPAFALGCDALRMAEADGEGFEPPLDLRPEQFSRLPP